MIIAILGVLKSGGAYVPVDPEYPEERIFYIEQDAKPKVVIDTDLFGLFEKEKDSCSKENLEKINTSNSLAYVIYTSGTTGKPKGVMIENNNLANYTNSFINYFKITNEDSILNLSTLAFDTSIEEIFPILLQGGKLYVRSDLD